MKRIILDDSRVNSGSWLPGKKRDTGFDKKGRRVSFFISDVD
ncbi:MAG TPA: hypothetical protein VK588_07780 [Chitinophagaceae bacterium]|nr:hypothetical protein [Chitinophagaceae bacterium]